MPSWTPRQPKIDYGAADAMRDLSALILHMVFKSAEEDKKSKYYELNLLADQLKETRRDRNAAIKSYDDMKMRHESFYGKGQEKDITVEGIEATGDLSNRYTLEIENYEDEEEVYASEARKLALEIAAADKVQRNIKSIGYEYGTDPLKYEAGDVTAGVLAPQFGIEEELMGRILEANPLLTSPQFLRSMELVRQQAEAAGEGIVSRKEEDIKKKELSKTIVVAETLINSSFMRQMGIAAEKTKAGDSDTDVKEFAVTMYNEKDQPYHIGDSLLPGGTLEQKYREVFNLHKTIESFSGTTPDKIGLTKYVMRWKQEWESEKDPISKAAIETNFKELFNIDLSQPEQFIYDEYIIGETEDPFESIIRDSYLEAKKGNPDLILKDYLDENYKNIMKMYKMMFGKKATLEDLKKKLSAVNE